MSLLVTMLPVYLVANLHCIGMCGPLVMLIGRHPGRYFYFAGRMVSFSLAGLLAGELGSVLGAQLGRWHLSCALSFLFGGVIVLLGVFQLLPLRVKLPGFLQRFSSRVEAVIGLLVTREGATPIFLFGLATVLLPCGQSLLVFSACALTGSAVAGWVNGFAFALLTSPALLFAMGMRRWLGLIRRHYQTVMGLLALVVGALAICRGLADVELLPHCVLSARYHIILY